MSEAQWQRLNAMTEWQVKNQGVPPSVDGTHLEWDKWYPLAEDRIETDS